MKLSKFSLVLLWLLLVDVLFCMPILENLNSLGRGDWDQMFFYDEVPQITALTYRQFPLWNPYYCGGVTMIGNPQNRFISPLVFLNIIFGVVVGLKLRIILYSFWGMLGMYFLCKHFKVSDLAALVGSTLFIVNGKFTLHLTEGHMWMLSVAQLPFVFLFFLKGLKDSKYLFISAFFLSLIFYEGGIYVFPFTCLFLAVFTFFHALQEKKMKPVLDLLFLLLLCMLLSGPKLFPTLEFLSQYPRLTPTGGAIPLASLYSLFIDKAQSMYRLYEPFPFLGWWNVGAYVGIVPAILSFLSLALVKQKWPLVVTGIFFFFLGVGNFASFSPWAILHKFPIFNNMWVPSRAFIFLIFIFSILIALYLDGLKPRFAGIFSGTRKFVSDRGKLSNEISIARNIFLFILLIFLVLDLLSVTNPIFREAFREFQINDKFRIKWDTARSFAANSFSQITVSRDFQFGYGGWSAMHPVLLENKGTVNGYESIPVKRDAVTPENDKDYKGEFFLQQGNGDVQLSYWSPNKLIFQSNLIAPDTLIINQNFDKNWKTNFPNKILPLNGLLSLELAQGHKKIVIYYLPTSFVLGVGALAAGGILCIFFPCRKT